MNARCCSNCAERYVFGKCPFNFPMRRKGVIARSEVEDWDDDYRSCDLFSWTRPLPKSPGKIEPLELTEGRYAIPGVIDKINEVIAELNRRVQ